MLLIGIGFISISIFIYINENYYIDIVNGERVFNRKIGTKKDMIYRCKIVIVGFSSLLGIFRILSSIIY